MGLTARGHSAAFALVFAADSAYTAARHLMPIAYLNLELRIEGAQSLKDRRQVLRSLKDRLRSRFNVSVAEMNPSDLWQSATLGLVGGEEGESDVRADDPPLDAGLGKAEGTAAGQKALLALGAEDRANRSLGAPRIPSALETLQEPQPVADGPIVPHQPAEAAQVTAGPVRVDDVGEPLAHQIVL